MFQQEPMRCRTPLNNVTTGVNTPRSEFDSSQSQLSSISGSKSNQDSDREVSTCMLSKRTLIYEESTPPRKEIQNQPKQTNLCLTKSKEVHCYKNSKIYL